MILATFSQTFRTLRLLKTLVVVPTLAAGSLAAAGGAMPEMAELAVRAASAYRTIQANVEAETSPGTAKASSAGGARPLSPAVLVASAPRLRPSASDDAYRRTPAEDRRRSSGSMVWLGDGTGG